MDLLAKRYASPFLVLDEFIRLHQLHDFTINLFETIAKENTHNARWEYYLHKVWDDISFEEYVEICENTKKKATMSNVEIGNVINESKMMLENLTFE